MAFDRIKSVITKAFGPIEQKAAPYSYDTWGLDPFLAPVTSSNVAVTPQNALRVPAVQLAVTLISTSIGSIPARLVRTVDGSSADATGHPAYRLISRVANDRMSAAKLRERLAMDALLHGNGFAFANRVGGRVVEIVRLDPHAVSIQLDPTTGEAIYRLATEGGRVLDPRDVIHVACPITLDGVTGVSPIHLGREAIGVALTLEMRAACLFGTSARPAGYIKVPAGTTPEVAKKNSALWEAAQGGAENSGRTPVLFDGMEFVPLTFNSVDAQFIESRREQVVEIARLFNVPATMLQEMSKGTFANTEQQARHFIKHNLTHWLNTIREELERALLTEEERDEYEIAFDTEALVAVDTLAATGRLKELRASGIATANEARAELGYEARPDGDALGSPFTTAGTPAPTPSKDTAE